ncbi:hypothetical protein OG21DRAFT_1137485 [Imleria badia]|nr:hypothetical protein OG21DRAFT_1137485 [Imleria badia]
MQDCRQRVRRHYAPFWRERYYCWRFPACRFGARSYFVVAQIKLGFWSTLVQSMLICETLRRYRCIQGRLVCHPLRAYTISRKETTLIMDGTVVFGNRERDCREKMTINFFESKMETLYVLWFLRHAGGSDLSRVHRNHRGCFVPVGSGSSIDGCAKNSRGRGFEQAQTLAISCAFYTLNTWCHETLRFEITSSESH